MADPDIFADLGLQSPTTGKKRPEAPSAPAIDIFSDLGLDLKPSPEAKATGDLPAVALASGLLNGVPIVGPALLGGAQRAAAGLESVASGTKYADELKRVQDRTTVAGRQNSGLSTAGNIAGATAGYVAGGIPALGAKALGYVGGMVPRMIAGGASNMLIGGTDAAVRGESPVVGGALGLVGGAAAPVFGGIAGAAANKLTQGAQYLMPTGIEGVSRPAANLINKAIAADDPAAVRAALAQAGELGMIADAGPSVTGITGALALKPGEGKSIVENALTGRAKGANDRIGGQIDSSLGPEVDPMRVNAALKAERSKVNSEYSAVHQGAPPVDPSGVLASIEAKLTNATGSQRTALQNLKSELIKSPAVLDDAGNVVKEQVLHSSSERLHNLRKDIDMLISGKAPGLGVERGAISSKQGALQDVRNLLDGALKEQVPGMAATDAASAALAARMQGIERGYGEVLGAAGPHPETFAANRAAQNAAVNEAENIGIRGRVGRMFGTGTQRDAVTLNKLLAGGEDGYSTANLKTAFGEQPVNSLLDTLTRERMFANTTNEVVQNSATARRAAAGKLLDESSPGTLNLTGATAAGMGVQAAKKWIADPLVSMILRTSSEPMRAEMARVLTMQGQSRDQVLTKLLALHARQNTISATGQALSNFANSGVNRLTMGATGTSRP